MRSTPRTLPPVKVMVLGFGLAGLCLLALMFRILVSHHFERAYEQARSKQKVLRFEPNPMPYTDGE